MHESFLYPEIPILEKIIRPLIVFLFLIIAFRLFGKRELGSLGPFDLIVLLTISNVLQNAMIGPDNSLTGGLIGALTVFAANYIFTSISYKFPGFEKFFLSSPTTLVQNGRILNQNLQAELLTVDDLRHALRKNEVDLDEELQNIKTVVLESDGAITITRRLPKEKGLTKNKTSPMKR